MKGLREFQIDIFGLANKQHEFRFEINDKLFATHEQSLIEKAKGYCHLVLQKTETMLTLDFQIDVEVELTCDRSLEVFMHPVSLQERLLIKYGDENQSLDEEVEVIRNDTSSINIGGWIYEYITVAIPMKKLHPRYQDEADENEESELIYSTPLEEPTDEVADPRWEMLKKLKDSK